MKDSQHQVPAWMIAVKYIKADNERFSTEYGPALLIP